MEDLLQRSTLIVLIGLPMWLARRPASNVVRALLVAMPITWFLLVYISPHFAQ